MSTSTTTTQLHQHLLTDIHYSRRLLLLHTAAAAPPPPTLIDQNHHSNSSDPYSTSNSFDANVIMVLSVLLCALICSLGLNSIIKCALRCSTNFVDSSSTSNSNNTISARLANTGVKRKALKTFPTVSYSADLKLPGLDSECVICLSEFSSGDKVRLLPKCNHGFHVRCIDKWLGSHSSCPTCRHCLIQTCHKIVGSSSSSQPAHPPPPQLETIVTIAPLEPEGLMRNYR